VYFLHFLAQLDSCQSNWRCLLSFPSSVPPILGPTSSRWASFPLSQDELASSGSYFDNPLSCHIPSWVKTETLNMHHRHRLPSSDCPTPRYKKIISTLVTLLTTQPRLYFISSLGRALRCSFSPMSHIHCTSAQWHSRWRTSGHSFTSQITYEYVNSCKKIF
jgi:hypothetical protein